MMQHQPFVKRVNGTHERDKVLDIMSGLPHLMNNIMTD